MFKISILCILSVICAACVASSVAVPPQLKPVPVEAEDLAPLTFQGMIVRIAAGTIGHHHEGLLKVKQYPHTWNTSLSAASDAFKVIASETLRRHRYNVLGGDNLLFGRDESAKASFQLGATLTQLTLNTYGALAGNSTEVKVGIDWQLYDVLVERVVFSKRTEGYAKYKGQAGDVVEAAFTHSLTNLLADGAFPVALRIPSTATVAKPSAAYAVAPCTTPAATLLPTEIENAFPAVMVVRSGESFGSAVVISPDGYALTAAHVVSSLQRVEVRSRSGLRLPADVLEVDKQQDVALIKLAGSGHACLSLTDQADVGSDVFAIGAPVTNNSLSPSREES